MLQAFPTIHDPTTNRSRARPGGPPGSPHGWHCIKKAKAGPTQTWHMAMGRKLFYFRRMKYARVRASSSMAPGGPRTARAHMHGARALLHERPVVHTGKTLLGDLGKSVAPGLGRLAFSHEEEGGIKGGVSCGPPPPGFVFKLVLRVVSGRLLRSFRPPGALVSKTTPSAPAF